PLSWLFFFHDTPPTDLYPLSLHDALPISQSVAAEPSVSRAKAARCQSGSSWSSSSVRRASCTVSTRAPTRSVSTTRRSPSAASRSEEHTSELQSLTHIVCRLLLEKKQKHT